MDLQARMPASRQWLNWRAVAMPSNLSLKSTRLDALVHTAGAPFRVRRCAGDYRSRTGPRRVARASPVAVAGFSAIELFGQVRRERSTPILSELHFHDVFTTVEDRLICTEALFTFARCVHRLRAAWCFAQMARASRYLHDGLKSRQVSCCWFVPLV